MYSKRLAVYRGMGNTAIIEVWHGKKQYKTDRRRPDTYRVTFTQDFNGGFVYHVSCFETLKDATAHVAEYPFFELQGAKI